MSRRKSPAVNVLSFFETAALETAQTVLAIAKDKVAARAAQDAGSAFPAALPKKKRGPKRKKPNAHDATEQSAQEEAPA